MAKLRAAALAVAIFLVVPAVAGAHTKVVYAGGPPAWAGTLGIAGVNNFLINRVTIHTGDTVVWNGASLAGGFHTVDLPPVGQGDLPLIVPTGTLVSGANDAAGNPFWFNGQPLLGVNPALGGPSGGTVYDGSKRVDSGTPTGPSDFAVTFTKPGAYRYFCDVHAGMQGWVIVKGKGDSVPSDSADATELKKEEERYRKEIGAVASHVRPPAHTVSVGASGPGGVELFAMFPDRLTVSSGTTVEFAMSQDTREVHTASFGPPDYLGALSSSFQSPVPNPAALYPSDVPKIVLTSTTHGNGFASTGAMDRDSSTPLPPSNTITFNQPGVYQYMCLIHPFMHGTIVVH